MSETTTAQSDALREELDRLRAENAALREARPVAPSDAVVHGRGRWRAVVSALCIVLAGFLVPVSITAAWARVLLVNEEAFVNTLAPLADDPGVQQTVTDAASAAISDAVNVDEITNALFDGLASLDLPPAAQSAIELLRVPAASGLQSLIDGAVGAVVQSDAFATAWEKALTATHKALVAIATGSDQGAVTVNAQGELGIQLGPIIEEVKSTLVAQGFGFAQSIPVIDTTIVIAQSDALPMIGTIYNLAVAAGTWLSLLALALFGAGVLAARRRTTALLGSGVGMAVGSLTLSAALAAGGALLALQAGSLGVPASVLDTVYTTVTGAMADTAVVFALLGTVIAIAAWLSGRWGPAVRLRTGVSTLVARARDGLRHAGLDTGRFGSWMHAQRLLVRIGILVLAVVVLVLLRPLSVADVLLTTLGALVVWLVAELLQSTPDELQSTPDELQRTPDDEAPVEEFASAGAESTGA